MGHWGRARCFGMNSRAIGSFLPTALFGGVSRGVDESCGTVRARIPSLITFGLGAGGERVRERDDSEVTEEEVEGGRR